MTSLKEYVKEKRPNLGESSVTTYNSILKNLYQKVFDSGEIDVRKFNDAEAILKYLKEHVPSSSKRKTILSALVVITDDQEYRDLMLNAIKTYNSDISKQQKTAAQKKNWVSSEERYGKI